MAASLGREDGNGRNCAASVANSVRIHYYVPHHLSVVHDRLGGDAWLTVLEALFLATARPVYRVIFEFWLTIFGVAFGLGVVSGIAMAFQFGTNWSVRSARLRTFTSMPTLTKPLGRCEAIAEPDAISNVQDHYRGGIDLRHPGHEMTDRHFRRDSYRRLRRHADRDIVEYTHCFLIQLRILVLVFRSEGLVRLGTRMATMP